MNTSIVLEEYRKDIPSTIGIYLLKSGAVDIYFYTIADKDRYIIIGIGKATIITRKGYLVEVIGVRKSIRVIEGRKADNTRAL